MQLDERLAVVLNEPPGGLDVDVVHSGSTTCVRLAGELDLATRHRVVDVLARLEEKPPQRIVIDLSDVSFIDSAGVYVVYAACERARRDGFELALAPGPQSVQRVFRLVGLESKLPFGAAEG